MNDQTPEARPRLPNDADRIPGLNVTVGEVDRACAILVAHGWAGGIPFDEAVTSLVPEDDPTLAADLALAAAVRRLDALGTWQVECDYFGKYVVVIDQTNGFGTADTLTAAINEALRDD